MKSFKQRDIVVVKVPFTDGTGYKIRPVLIISNSLLDNVNEFIFLPVTGTNFNDSLSFTLLKEMARVDFPKPSFIRLNKINSLHRQFILKKVNEITPETLNLIIKRLFRIFI